MVYYLKYEDDYSDYGDFSKVGSKASPSQQAPPTRIQLVESGPVKTSKPRPSTFSTTGTSLTNPPFEAASHDNLPFHFRTRHFGSRTDQATHVDAQAVPVNRLRVNVNSEDVIYDNHPKVSIFHLASLIDQYFQRRRHQVIQT